MLAIAVGVAGAACNGSKSPVAGSSVQGSYGLRDDGSAFLVEQNFGGRTTTLRILDLHWGRLVDVFGLDAGGGEVLMQEDFVIAAGLVSDPFSYELGVNPVTGTETLTILRDVSSPAGFDEFIGLLQAAEANRTPVFDNGAGGSGLFTMIPRNAAVVIRFNDLLDAQTVNGQTVRVRTGSPALEPFEARVIVDTNHGDLVDYDGNGQPRFFSTRVILDPAVSELEAFQTSPPLPINGLGFPASIRVDLSNIEVRIPTRRAPAFGQQTILRNPSGHGVDVAGNGTADVTSPTADVVRAARAGGSSTTTADPHNGFLRDDIPPQLLGVQRSFIETPPVQDPIDPNVFTVGTLRFESRTCARRPRVGDVLEQPGIFAEVIASAGNPVNGVVSNLRVRLLMFPPDFSGPGDWTGSALGETDYLTVYEELADSGLPECFVVFSPAAPDPDQPTVGLGVDATAGLRFSEPMDPASLTAFDSLTLTRVPIPTTSDDFVIGQVGRTQDLRGFSFVPGLNLAHLQGTGETYFLKLRSDGLAPRDLAGNRLPGELPQITFQLAPAQGTVRNGGRVTRFSQPDEDEPFGGDLGSLPEWTGQHFYDLQGEFIRPRPVSRFQAVADRSNAIIGLMNAFPQGVQTPLSPFGCRLQHIYRYIDVGFSLSDSTNYNIDVEGLNWAPANGQVTADNFPAYEMRLAHCRHLPDEVIDPQSLFPKHPNSGLTPAYAGQSLTPEVAPVVVVHPRDRGYIIDPGRAFQTPSGTLMIPWPMNTDPSREPLRYTWRDTTILGRDGRNGVGADPEILDSVGITRQIMYDAEQIQTIALPLLIEHRCYPAATDALGNNSLDIAFAVNSSRRPFFRAFSVGGFAAGGQIVTVDPDLEIRANGGFNPSMGGAPSPGQDPNVYYGAIDLVVRVSRSVSVWFEVSDPTGGAFESPQFERPLVEPLPQDQPVGTAVELAFRGALNIQEASSMSLDPRFNANQLDAYGNHYSDLNMARNLDKSNLTIGFLTGTEVWNELSPDAVVNPMGIDGAQYYQIRASFSSDPQTSLVPTLSAIALLWE